MRFKKKIGIKSDFNYNKFVTWYSAKMTNQKNFLDIKNNDPAPHGGKGATYVQKVSNKVTLIRDREVVKRIEFMLEKFDRVLVVFGGSHLITQELLFKKALGEPEYIKLY